MAAKKTKKKKPTTADKGMAALLKAQTEKIENERAEYEKKYPPFKRKAVISPENAVKIVTQIAEFVGVSELMPEQVQQVSEFVSSGQLELKKSGLFYNLRRAVKNINGDPQRAFEMREIPDADFESNEVDGFKVGMLFVQGRGDEVTQDEMRAIARMAIRLDKSLFKQLPVREVMGIYSLYTLFFLGQ